MSGKSPFIITIIEKEKVAAKKPKRIKHIPQRTCVGCRAVLSKRNLIRIVRTSEGIKIDPTGKLAGRGAYLHDVKACWDKALKGSLANALKTNINEQDLDVLNTFMATLHEDTIAEKYGVSAENKKDKEA